MFVLRDNERLNVAVLSARWWLQKRKKKGPSLKVQGERVCTLLKHRNRLGRIWLFHDSESVMEIGFCSGCWLRRVRKTIGEIANVDSWMDNDVTLSFLLLLVQKKPDTKGHRLYNMCPYGYGEKMMGIGRQMNADVFIFSVPENRV